MPLARTYSIALVGVEGHVVEVEVGIANSLPAMILVGPPDTALREARDRIIRVAWTLADLAGKPRPTEGECHAAPGLWLGVHR